MLKVHRHSPKNKYTRKQAYQSYLQTTSSAYGKSSQSKEVGPSLKHWGAFQEAGVFQGIINKSQLA